MNLIYDAAVMAMNAFVRVYGKCLRKSSQGKFSRFVKGQRGLIPHIRKSMESIDRSVPTIWFHAASLGEYSVARPLIDAMRRRGKCNIVMTFFSPSGYEPVSQKHPGIDRVFYLPIDTRRNARRFINIVKPDRAIIMISEYWPNYLQRLKFNSIRTYLVSAIIREDSVFFRWYGKMYRRALTAFRHIFVLNDESRFNLRMLGFTDVTVEGDALFDNAALVAKTPWKDEVLERFTDGRKTFIAGSISDDKDLRLVAELVKHHPEVAFILVPHDIKQATLDEIALECGPSVKFYTKTQADDTGLNSTQCLIVDCVGKLAYLYRYGTWAYIGGGFTPLLHSVIEATVYGLPVSFGPRIERKVTPQQLIELGLGAIVNNAAELEQWFQSLASNDARLTEIKEQCNEYVARNVGATEHIVSTVTHKLWEKK